MLAKVRGHVVVVVVVNCVVQKSAYFMKIKTTKTGRGELNLG